MRCGCPSCPDLGFAFLAGIANCENCAENAVRETEGTRRRGGEGAAAEEGVEEAPALLQPGEVVLVEESGAGLVIGGSIPGSIQNRLEGAVRAWSLIRRWLPSCHVVWTVLRWPGQL